MQCLVMHIVHQQARWVCLKRIQCSSSAHRLATVCASENYHYEYPAVYLTAEMACVAYPRGGLCASGCASASSR